MINILFPTDFSDHAKVALEHAIKIVNALDAKLHLITTFVEHRTASSMKSIKRSIIENQTNELNHIMSSVSSLLTTDQVPEVAVIEGGVSYGINKYIHENAIDLVIMGTQGKNSVSNILFGSTTKNVIDHISIPVIAIPSGIKYGPGDPKFLLALDNKLVESSPAWNILRKISNGFERKVDIIHVSSPDEEIPYDPFVETFLEDSMGEVVLIEGGDPTKVIDDYVGQNNIEMLAMIKRKHGLVRSLLVQDHTNAELSNASIPLLIIPE